MCFVNNGRGQTNVDSSFFKFCRLEQTYQQGRERRQQQQPHNDRMQQLRRSSCSFAARVRGPSKGAATLQEHRYGRNSLAETTSISAPRPSLKDAPIHRARCCFEPFGFNAPNEGAQVSPSP